MNHLQRKKLIILLSLLIISAQSCWIIKIQLLLKFKTIKFDQKSSNYNLYNCYIIQSNKIGCNRCIFETIC